MPEKRPAGAGRTWTDEDAERETLKPPASLAAEMLLACRYKVLRRLGEGGMGSVWLVEDTRLDHRRVAVKMLPSVLAGKKMAYRQVKQEALVAMMLAHPNIATVRAFEEDEGGAPFLVMDYIEGEGLDEILSERGPLGEDEVQKLLGPVAAALDYAHSQGVVHRDVKPGNVMVRKDGTPFVLDFGIAREIQETMTRVTGKFSSGTLLYMSPEQIRGRAPKAAQDVYSFAAMAYECLAGHPPFYRGAVEDQIKNETPEELPEGVASELLRKGIMAGLAKAPEERPGSCAEVLAWRGKETAEQEKLLVNPRKVDQWAEHSEKWHWGERSRCRADTPGDGLHVEGRGDSLQGETAQLSGDDVSQASEGLQTEGGQRQVAEEEWPGIGEGHCFRTWMAWNIDSAGIFVFRWFVLSLLRGYMEPDQVGRIGYCMLPLVAIGLYFVFRYVAGLLLKPVNQRRKEQNAEAAELSVRPGDCLGAFVCFGLSWGLIGGLGILLRTCKDFPDNAGAALWVWGIVGAVANYLLFRFMAVPMLLASVRKQIAFQSGQLAEERAGKRRGLAAGWAVWLALALAAAAGIGWWWQNGRTQPEIEGLDSGGVGEQIGQHETETVSPESQTPLRDDTVPPAPSATVSGLQHPSGGTEVVEPPSENPAVAGSEHGGGPDLEKVRKAAEQGDATGQRKLGLMYQTGHGVAQSDAEAVFWYRKAAEQGEEWGQVLLGAMYADGRGVPQSDTEAAVWYRKAAERGNALGQCNLGELYENGRGVPQSDAEAASWYRLAAEQGDASAQRKLGLMYQTGRGVAQSDAEAVSWFRKAAEQGEEWGQVLLGAMYADGRGVPRSDTEAAVWYRKAAEQGNALGQCNLGELYENGRGVPQSDAEAASWYRRAAQQGDASAQRKLGLMYQTGQGVAQSDMEAVSWYRQAAEQGDEWGQVLLGAMYNDGRGVQQSDAAAVLWFRKAAEQGNALGQNYLGEMYENGCGVPQSDATAASWYRKAAAQGNEEAKAALARMGLM